ncbi:MAG TPA: hypothetical protein VM308_10110 [Sphingomicrobium sp.]|nr:hypothetical protein [Sphingomicrobium sp.]
MLHSKQFNLARLRGAFSDQFTAWELAAQRNDMAAARAARAGIRHVAFDGLAEPPATLGGFYLFVDLEKEGLSGLNYIGIADTMQRSIGRRIVDRLRDDSALDVALDRLSDDEARSIILRRLLCALPKSGHNYVNKHIRVGHLFRRSPVVILIGSDAEKPFIRETEKVLISSAAAAGAPLANRQHVNFRGSVGDPALKLARAVIRQAVAEGLPEEGALMWIENLRGVTQPA